MRARSFTVADGGSGFTFLVDREGGLRARPSLDGTTPVIGGQWSLRGDVEKPEEWGAVQEATGNNAQISDGEELYAGAGFGDPLIQGQVDDVLWALGDLAERGQGRLLELGCGPGFLLEALSGRLSGWTVVGVDPSPISVGQATTRGLEAHEGFLDTVDLEPGFDAVVVMGNLQLHPDPVDTLRRLAHLTAPGGRLFLDSKNPRSVTRRAAGRLMGVPGVSRVKPVNKFAAHALHGLRVAMTREQLTRALGETGWGDVELRTTPPRLLRFDNSHDLARGPAGLLWRVTDAVDRRLDERAWIQANATRQA